MITHDLSPSDEIDHFPVLSDRLHLPPEKPRYGFEKMGIGGRLKAYAVREDITDFRVRHEHSGESSHPWIVGKQPAASGLFPLILEDQIDPSGRFSHLDQHPLVSQNWRRPKRSA